MARTKWRISQQEAYDLAIHKLEDSNMSRAFVELVDLINDIKVGNYDLGDSSREEMLTKLFELTPKSYYGEFKGEFSNG